MPYHIENMAMLFKKTNPISKGEFLSGKKIACQIGTVMEIWLKKQFKNIDIIIINRNIEGVEALKTGHVEGVFLDTMQALIFAKKNTNLAYAIISNAENRYEIVFKKGSPLREQINQSLETLKNKGAIEKLKKKYLGIES